MSISVADADKNLLENVPIYYQEFAKVFGTTMQSVLPEHGPQNISIDEMPDTEPPSGKPYPMSQDELELLPEYIEEMVNNSKIRPGIGTAGCPVFFVKEKLVNCA